MLGCLPRKFTPSGSKFMEAEPSHVLLNVVQTEGQDVEVNLTRNAQVKMVTMGSDSKGVNIGL